MAEYIEREAVIKAIRNDVMGGLNAEFIVNKLPAADVRPVVRGKWRELWKRADSTDYECTACRGLLLDVSNDDEHPLVSYCPNCGADMREGE